jgi:hypothetical protein
MIWLVAIMAIAKMLGAVAYVCFFLLEKLFELQQQCFFSFGMINI